MVGGGWDGSETTFAQRAGKQLLHGQKSLPPPGEELTHTHRPPSFLFLCVIGHHLCVLYSSFSSSSSSLHFLTIFFFFFHSPGREKNWKGDDRDTQRQNWFKHFCFFWLISCLGHFEQKCVRSSWFIRRPCVVHPIKIRRTAGSDALGIVFSRFFWDSAKNFEIIIYFSKLLKSQGFSFLNRNDLTWFFRPWRSPNVLLCEFLSLVFVCKNKMETLKKMVSSAARE